MPASKTARTKTQAKDFNSVYARLCRILQQHGDKLSVAVQKPGTLWMDVAGISYRGKPLSYAGVRLGKNYVSYYLMPASVCKNISPELMKRKQGNACFNFTAVDEKLFAELERLTAEGFENFTPENLEKMEKSNRKK